MDRDDWFPARCWCSTAIAAEKLQVGVRGSPRYVLVFAMALRNTDYLFFLNSIPSKFTALIFPSAPRIKVALVFPYHFFSNHPRNVS